MFCLACHGERLATMLDTATVLRFYRAAEGGVREMAAAPLSGAGLEDVPGLLSAWGAATLVCGGITACRLQLLEQQGVKVLAWVSGPAEEAAAAYAAGTLGRLARPWRRSGQCPGADPEACPGKTHAQGKGGPRHEGRHPHRGKKPGPPG
jgi:hypothetical protein